MFGDKLKGQLRHLITALGAGLIGSKFAEYVNPDMIEVVVGAVFVAVGSALSWIEKKYPAIEPIIDAIKESKQGA